MSLNTTLMNSEAGPSSTGRYQRLAAIRTCPRAFSEFTPALELNGQRDKDLASHFLYVIISFEKKITKP